MKSMDYLMNILPKITEYPLEKITLEEQNKEYEGTRFLMDEQSFRSRKAKQTPKKAGYFVAFWEKDETNKNKAYDSVTACDKLIITIFDQEKIGQFVFPKELLVKQKILMSGTHKGKMALRVYPDWVNELNKTALASQNWQRKWFIDLTKEVDIAKLRNLYFNK